MTYSNQVNPTGRFSNRVADYVRYRPDYPPEAIEFLRGELGLNSASIVADIGSGTGIFTKQLLETGCAVLGVEPNQEMRAAGEEFLRGFDKFKSVDGTAEATNLSGNSVNFVTAAQAFHWFDIETSMREFRRVLKNGGWIVLIWNNPQIDGSAFMRDYERFKIEFGTDYTQIRANEDRESVLNNYLTANFGERIFANSQQFDLTGLKGRALSSSYIPTLENPRYAAMITALESVFERNADNGLVTMLYDTHVFYKQF